MTKYHAIDKVPLGANALLTTSKSVMIRDYKKRYKRLPKDVLVFAQPTPQRDKDSKKEPKEITLYFGLLPGSDVNEFIGEDRDGKTEDTEDRGTAANEGS